MKNSVFLVFTLVVFSGMLASHALLRNSLSEAPQYNVRIEQLEHERAQAELRTALAENRLLDFKENVATLLPGSIKTSKSAEAQYQLRALASVSQDQKALKIERASGLLENGKREFRAQRFREANAIFSDIIQKYPDSSHVPEAHFLLAEGQFQLKEYEASIATIDRLINSWPESELSGFALLRLGRIFEIQDRLDDASDIYKAVLQNFKQPTIHDQAVASLKGVQL